MLCCIMLCNVEKTLEHQAITGRIEGQTEKYVVRAKDLPRASELSCAQRPIKRAEFEKYT